jgi:hypothetical protein
VHSVLEFLSFFFVKHPFFWGLIDLDPEITKVRKELQLARLTWKDECTAGLSGDRIVPENVESIVVNGYRARVLQEHR